MVKRAAKLSPAGERAAKLYKLRQVEHQVSHRRDGKVVVGVCTCGFETRGARVMDARKELDRHLSDADPDQLVRRLVDETMKVYNRLLKKLASREDRDSFRLEMILYHINRLEPPLDDRDRKKLQAIGLLLEAYRGDV